MTRAKHTSVSLGGRREDRVIISFAHPLEHFLERALWRLVGRR